MNELMIFAAIFAAVFGLGFAAGAVWMRHRQSAASDTSYDTHGWWEL